MLTRRDLMASSGALLGTLACGSGSKEPDAPLNVLFLFPDQMRAHAMGCMGNPDVKSPHLDKLASEGVLFRNHLANTPVCCPARAIILTGKYAHANGMVANDLRLRESETSVAELFAEAGYRTGFIGKWHLDGGPRQPGWIPPGPRRQGFEFWAANEVSHRHFDTQYFRDDPEPIPIKRFEAEVWADLGIEFLQRTREDGRPFFLTIQMGPPHNPYIAPEDYMAMYDPEAITLRPNYRGEESNPNPASNPNRRIPGRKEITAYYAMITALDAEVGRLMTELDALGLRENTIVIVSSDHGDMLGSQGARLKRKPWEESIKVPGIVRHPRVPGGRVTDELFSHVDMAPTLLSLCGLDPAPGMQGSDLSAVILGESESGPESAYFQIMGPYISGGVAAGWRGVRTKRYMYARTKEAPWVLYDLDADPYELDNLVDKPEAAEIQAELEGMIADWMERTGDSWEHDWTVPVEDRGRLYRHETFYTVDDFLEWAAENPELAEL